MQQAEPLAAAGRDQRRSRTPFIKRTDHHQQAPQPAPQPAAAASSPSPSLSPSPTEPQGATPTARALVPDGVDALRRLAERADVVTVRSTIEASATAGTSKAAPVPVGPIVGGVLAGVAVVLLAAGVWWWWVANKPRQRQQKRARPVPSTKAGVVPAPISYARSRPSTSSAVKGSLEKVPLATLSSGAPAALAKGRGGAPGVSGSRNVSGSSTAPLVPAGASDSSSSFAAATSPVKKTWMPATPSPLALGAVVSVPAATAAADDIPEPPRWGQAPFAPVPAPSASGGGGGQRTSGHLSASGHSHGGSTDGGAGGAYSVSPNSGTHLYVPRRTSASGPLYEEGGSSQGHHGRQQQQGGPNNRYSNVSDASRYSQADAGYAPDRRLSSISDGHSAGGGGGWGGSRGHEGYAAPPAQAYGAGYDGGSSGQYGYGGGYGGGVAYGDPYSTGAPGADGGQEFVSDGRASDGYRLDSYYRPQ